MRSMSDDELYCPPGVIDYFETIPSKGKIEYFNRYQIWEKRGVELEYAHDWGIVLSNKVGTSNCIRNVYQLFGKGDKVLVRYRKVAPEKDCARDSTKYIFNESIRKREGTQQEIVTVICVLVDVAIEGIIFCEIEEFFFEFIYAHNIIAVTAES